MNTSMILNVLLAIALVILSIKLAFFTPNNNQANDNTASAPTAIENIMSRTSIRSYTDQPVEDAKVETILRAAMAAPTSGNKQPWRFVVVRDKNTLKSISANLNTMKMAEKAQLAIIVCGDVTKTYSGEGRDYWIEDASAASENLLLAAHSIGLGAVWCGVYPMQERVAFVKDLLKLPEDVIPLNVIPIGYPTETPMAKDKWKPEFIHQEMWGDENK